MRSPEIAIPDNRTCLEAGPDGCVSMIALGDLILCGEWETLRRPEQAEQALAQIIPACSRADLVFANIEGTTEGGAPPIAKEPRLIACPEVIATVLRTLRVDIACLANNHSFDANLEGFLQLRRTLDHSGIPHLGAGTTEAEAARPLIVERRGVRFGWLAYTDRETRPSHVAQQARCGVHLFDEERARRAVEQLRERVDHVVLSLHWGVEYCHAPSPDQLRVARGLVEAGAALVLGHHAHVIQGVEVWRRGVVAYNLGNATTTDLYCGGRRAIRPTRRSSSSLLLRARFSRQRLESVDLLPIRASAGRILADDPVARQTLEQANRTLARGITPGQWKRMRLWEDVVLRTVRKLDPRVIRSVRPRHLASFFRNFGRALGGRGPA